MTGDWTLADFQDLEEAVPLEQALDVLRDPLALYGLSTLEEHGPMALEELADVTTAWMNASERAVATSADRDRVRIGLHHATLPRLDDAGLVTFDPSTGRVALDDLPAELAALLAEVRSRERPPDEPGSAP